VSDSTGAVVVGAQVTATSDATGQSQQLTTDQSGNYRFDLLKPGTYTIKVSKAGFSTATGEKLDVAVARATTVNITLRPGTEAQTVTVTSEAPVLDLEKTSVGLDVTPTMVENLPLNGRDFANLAYLAPGAQPVDSYDPTKNRAGIFGINGSSGRNVNVTVNGIDNKDNTVGGPVMQFPLEAIQEFNIATQRFSAANGRSEGAAVNVVTKSGSNTWHGSAYVFDTETDLNALDKLSEPGPKPDFSRQQFGGSVGGFVRRDSDFVFFALERQREHTAIPVTQDAFSELSLVKNLGADPVQSIPTPYFDWRYTGRYDHRFNSKHNGFITYSGQTNKGLNDQSTNRNDLTAGNFTVNELVLANATLNSVLTPRVVNSFTFGHQYWRNLIDTEKKVPTFCFLNACGSGSEITFGTNTNVPQESFQRKWQFRDDLSFNIGRHSLKTGVDYVWEPLLGGFFEFNPTLELDFYDKPSTILNNRTLYPQGFATPGAVSGMSATAGNPDFTLPDGSKMLGLYFQDDWKATQRLTMNLGLRWDKDYNLIGAGAQTTNRTFQQLKAINSIFTSRLPHDDNLDFSPRVGFSWDLTGSGRHVVRGGYGLYYGQVFLNIPLFMLQQIHPTLFATVLSISGGGAPVAGVGQPCSDCGVPGTSRTLQNYRFGVDPLPTIPAPPTGFVGGEVGRLMDPNYRNPYSQQFNGGYAFQVDNNSVIELEYVHTLGLHESKTININPTQCSAAPCPEGRPIGSGRVLDAAFRAKGLPLLSRIDDEQSIGRSRYDGANLSYRRRMSKHFSINTHYTLSRAVAYKGVAAAFRNRPVIPERPFRSQDFGPSPNDERHRWVVSSVVDLPWGFQISPIMQVASARPYTAIAGQDVYAVGSGRGNADAIVPTGSPGNLQAFATLSTSAQRACLAGGTCVESHFDQLRGQMFFQLDTRVTKMIKFGERSNLRLMFQGFDLTNRANFGNNFQGNVRSSSFGQPVGYITPAGSIVPKSFRAEFGAQFTF
jgi:hypothetical protein